MNKNQVKTFFKRTIRIEDVRNESDILFLWIKFEKKYRFGRPAADGEFCMGNNFLYKRKRMPISLDSKTEKEEDKK